MKPTIVKTSQFDPKNITMSRVENQYIRVSYNKHPLLLQTDHLKCILNNNFLTFTSVNCLNTLNKLDIVAKTIGSKQSETLFNKKLSVDEVPYSQLLIDNDKSCKLKLNNPTFFDSDGVKIDKSVLGNYNTFEAILLIKFNGIKSGNNGLKWDYSVMQIRINEFSQLPAICLISSDEEVDTGSGESEID